jgi:hypothetical protein
MARAFIDARPSWAILRQPRPGLPLMAACRAATRADECYELAHERTPELRGIVSSASAELQSACFARSMVSVHLRPGSGSNDAISVVSPLLVCHGRERAIKRELGRSAC